MPRSTRRRFLAGTSIGLALAAVPGALRAFSLEEPGEDLRRSYESACGHEAYHRELVAEVQQILSDQGYEADEEQILEVASAIDCPICGCPITNAI